jgi:hypothetical protein
VGHLAWLKTVVFVNHYPFPWVKINISKYISLKI